MIMSSLFQAADNSEESQILPSLRALQLGKTGKGQEDPDEQSPWIHRKLKIIAGHFRPHWSISAYPVAGDPDFSDDKGPTLKEYKYVEQVVHFQLACLAFPYKFGLFLHLVSALMFSFDL